MERYKAEGWGRASQRDDICFLVIARGSILEDPFDSGKSVGFSRPERLNEPFNRYRVGRQNAKRSDYIAEEKGIGIGN